MGKAAKVVVQTLRQSFNAFAKEALGIKEPLNFSNPINSAH